MAEGPFQVKLDLYFHPEPQAIAFIFFNFLIIEFTSRRGKNLAYPFGIRRDMHIPFNHQDGIIGYLSTIIAL